MKVPKSADSPRILATATYTRTPGVWRFEADDPRVEREISAAGDDTSRVAALLRGALEEQEHEVAEVVTTEDGAVTAYGPPVDLLADVPRGPIAAQPPAKFRGRDEDIARLAHALRGVELGDEDLAEIAWLVRVFDAQAKTHLLSWLERTREAGRQEMIADSPSEHAEIAVRLMADHVGQLVTDLTSARAELEIQRAGRAAAEQRVAELESGPSELPTDHPHAAKVAALRELAGVLAAHPEMPMPEVLAIQGCMTAADPSGWGVDEAASVERVRQAAEALGVGIEAEQSLASEDEWHHRTVWTRGGVSLRLSHIGRVQGAAR